MCKSTFNLVTLQKSHLRRSCPTNLYLVKIQRQKQIRITLILSVKRRNIAFEIAMLIKMDKTEKLANRVRT
jgi:hypothetical protein